MDLELHKNSEQSQAGRCVTALPSLPKRLKVLYVSAPNRVGLDLSATFAADSATRVTLTKAQGAAEAVEQLGEHAFDAVFVLHDPPAIDALQLIEGLRAGGMEEPVIVFGSGDADALAPLVYEVGGDGYAHVLTTKTRTLLWMTARAIERFRFLQENRRLAQLQRHRAQQECEESRRLLDEQRKLPGTLESSGGFESTEGLADSLVTRYEQLLRTHVIMGGGNLEAEIHQLAQQLIEAHTSPRDVILLHTAATGQQIQGLGGKGARHILARADLMILDVLARLSSGYRSRYLEAAGQRT